MTVDKEKKALRARAKKVRNEAFAKHGALADEALAQRGISFARVRKGAVVSGFLPIRNEIDPRPLMRRLHAEGFVTALPVMVGKNKPLVFRSWSEGEPLEEVVWGIKEPPAHAAVVLPDIILVPLLAFDERGFRVGYGGGFYDRSIEQLRSLKKVVTIGLAFDEQRVEAVPREDHDEALDWMLTPNGALRCAL